MCGDKEARRLNCQCGCAVVESVNAKCYADRYSDLKAGFGFNAQNLINHNNNNGKGEGRAFNRRS